LLSYASRCSPRIDVDNPEVCHDHSDIPDTWPPLEEILQYAVRVRERITESINSKHASENRRLARGLWLAYEHEAMHLETFLYMLLQSDRISPPPGPAKPDFVALAAEAVNRRSDNKWHHVPASNITLGLNDAENDAGPDRYFGWDNERPARQVDVPAFEAQGRPISNGEYAAYLEATGLSALPASWISHTPDANGFKKDDENHENLSNAPGSGVVAKKSVRTVYGPVPLELALDWPVMASYDELAAYATWAGGRIPTLEEARSIYNYVEMSKQDKVEKIPSKLISAVNG
jgi:L-histidine Nalpha-methyltransferase / hercynylcysteine S-oxide synthase